MSYTTLYSSDMPFSFLYSTPMHVHVVPNHIKHSISCYIAHCMCYIAVCMCYSELYSRGMLFSITLHSSKCCFQSFIALYFLLLLDCNFFCRESFTLGSKQNIQKWSSGNAHLRSLNLFL